MKILPLLIRANLGMVLFSITTCWSLILIQTIFTQFLFIQIINEEHLTYILIIVGIWGLLFFGLFAKIKGFKVANGILSIGISILSIHKIYNLWMFFILFNDNNNEEYSKFILSFFLMFLILLASIYTSYATLYNQNFQLVYNNKDDVVLKTKFFWRCLIIVLISVIVYISIVDLGL